MIGPIVNGCAVVAGSVSGAFLGDRISQNLRTKLPMIFGACSMCLGIVMIIKVKVLPAVILAVILGTIIGELMHLEDGIKKVAGVARKFIEKFAKSKNATSQEEFMDKFIPVLVLFCASGTGIFGAMNEGMTGNSELLMVKAFLDLFTAAIFATGLGYTVAVTAIPQFAIQAGLFAGAAMILPMTTPTMIADFSACGGVIMLATGFRICGITPFPVANMLPSLVLAMPISVYWLRLVA